MGIFILVCMFLTCFVVYYTEIRIPTYEQREKRRKKYIVTAKKALEKRKNRNFKSLIREQFHLSTLEILGFRLEPSNIPTEEFFNKIRSELNKKGFRISVLKDKDYYYYSIDKLPIEDP